MRRQHAIVQGHIEDDILFALLGTALAADIDGLLREIRSTLRQAVDEVFADAMSDINMVFAGDVRAAAPVVRDAAAELRLRAFSDTVKTLKDRHESLLRTITLQQG